MKRKKRKEQGLGKKEKRCGTFIQEKKDIVCDRKTRHPESWQSNEGQKEELLKREESDGKKNGAAPASHKVIS